MSQPIKVVIDRIGPSKYVWHEIRANGSTVCGDLKAAQRTLEHPSRKAIDQAIGEFNASYRDQNKPHLACNECRAFPSNSL